LEKFENTLVEPDIPQFKRAYNLGVVIDAIDVYKRVER